MAEDDAKSSKAKFKSKWNRVFKEKEEHEQNPKHTNSFKLDEDVTAFLKPSTDKAESTRPSYSPKIDIAIAQRWPDANEVRRASATATPASGLGRDTTPNGFRKPKRRKGLTVGFVKTVPEIIGEGGDEALDPPSEVGRQRAMVSRSVSDRRPSAIADGSSWPDPPPDSRQARISNGNEDDFRPQPVRRANTSFNEFSPSVQRKQISPQLEEDLPSKPMLYRTPTGLGSQDEHLDTHDDNDEGNTVPRIDTRFTFEQTESPQSNSASSAVRRKDVPASGLTDSELWIARKRELRSGEGMTLRRASAMRADEDEDEEQKRESLALGMQPSQEQYETLSRPDAESLMPEVPTPSSALSPRSTTSSGGPSPSPFTDPKYLKRRSQEIPADQAPFAQPQSFRQPRPTYQPSYMRSAEQSAPQLPPPARPPIPQVQSASDWTAENERPSQRSNQPSYMRATQPSSEDFISTRPAPAPSQNISVTQNPSQTREGSPMRDRIFGDGAVPGQSRPEYFKPNGSSGSLNFFPPSPKQSHSRGSSRDGDAPQQQVSAGTGYQQSLPSPQFKSQTPSPQSASPRSSMVGKTSLLSPYARGPSPTPQEYFAGQKPSQAAPARSPAGNLQVEDSASRPSSSASNRSFQRPANYFSAPRPPQMQQPQSQQVSNQQQGTRGPSILEPGGETQQRQADYSTSQQAPPQTWSAKTAAVNLRPENAQRPGSSGSVNTRERPTVSPMPTSEGNPAADAAYADFATRVAHMKGVFRLTAEKERSSDRCSSRAWLRTGLWWYLRGKAGLEIMLQQRPRSSDGQHRELLTQPHVDLAKTWWILSDPLDLFDEDRSPSSAASADGGQDMMLKQSITTLRSHIKSLALSMGRSQLMPPPQSLIQGQDTRIWLEYPHFTSDAAAVLGGVASKSYILDQPKQSLQPLDALPLGDTKDTFCYGRFPVEVSLNTDDASTDRVILPCMLTMLRGKRDFLASFVIASQHDLVNVTVAPRQSNDRGLTWHDVSWKASAFGMIVRLPHNFDLTVRMQERDFRSVWNLVEYSRKVEHSFRTEQNEKLVHEAHLAELQYADSSNANAFPSDKLRRCTALVFERTAQVADASGQRKMHRGYRLLLLTDPDHKSLASASHEVCRKGPLLFEFITDAAAHGMAAMVVRIREESRQCRMLLVFQDVGSRQSFYDVLNGLTVAPDEAIVGKMNLTSLNIEPATQVEGFAQSGHQALRALQWQKIGVTNGMPEDHTPYTVESESLRVIARHSTGCVTDRLNLSKGELLLRLPCANTPSMQMLRRPQEDMGMSIDTRHSHGSVTDGIAELLQTVCQQSTIRTFTFPSHDDLHAFQVAITGCSVRYDGLASTLSIARRRMVVPIYKKWEASNVRLQLVSHSNVVQLLAFMEDFSHADAMCFQVKSTDVFETVKGDGKGKKWAVKMVDAKFSLPHQPEKGEAEISPEEKVQRRFVNLEGLDYREEHDDITVGFETVEGESIYVSTCRVKSKEANRRIDRDRFAQALPAQATVGRGITLKRRI